VRTVLIEGPELAKVSTRIDLTPKTWTNPPGGRVTKYTERQKVAAVKAYRKGTGGLRATAKAHGVGFDSLRKWVSAYSVHGKIGVTTKKRTNYDPVLKLEVVRRVHEEGLSCRQAAALYNIRRPDQIAEWQRLYADHGAEALQPGWKREQTTMSQTPKRRNVQETPADDQRSREELLRDLEQLRAENAYLKKVQALARTKSRSAHVKGR
jgi:transposase